MSDTEIGQKWVFCKGLPLSSE